MARGLVPRGDLGFCHYERSEVIQKQVLLAMGLLLSLRSIANAVRIVIANAVWRSVAMRLLPPRHKCGSWQAHI